MNKHTHKKNSTFAKQGFTLIELLVVIAIIGVLSTLAVVSLGNARAKSRDATRVSDIKQIQTALELYFADSATYPVQGTTAALLVLGGTGATTLSNTNAFSDTAAGGTYMAKVPADPGTTAYSYKATDTAGDDCTASPCVDYNIAFTLEGALGSLDGASTATSGGVQ